MNDHISTLDISTRTQNVLLADGIVTVSQLLRLTSREIRHIPNMGKISHAQVLAALGAQGLKPFPDGEATEVRKLRQLIDQNAEAVRAAFLILEAARPLVMNLERFRDAYDAFKADA